LTKAQIEKLKLIRKQTGAPMAYVIRAAVDAWLANPKDEEK
jgi:hypothetical protein